MSLGSITIDLLARTGSFETNTRKAEKRMEELGKTARRVGTIVGTAFVGAVSVAAVQVNRMVRESREITQLSRLSGEAAGKFQEWSIAARSVGIEQDKLADILKDTQDKVGDFLQTGGGAMADFFEQIAPKVGVTAEQFRKLGGSDALQLYVDSLQKANVSQSEMTFYMEAIASDSMKLIPLLRDSGEGMRKWAQYAKEVGAVLDDETIVAAGRLDDETRKLKLTLDGVWNKTLPALIPKVTELAEALNSQGFRDGFSAIITGAVSATTALVTFTEAITNAMGRVQEWLNLQLGGNRRMGGENLGEQMRELAAIEAEIERRATSSMTGLSALGLQSLKGLERRREVLKEAIALNEMLFGNPASPEQQVRWIDPSRPASLLEDRHTASGGYGSGNQRVDPRAADKAAAEAKRAMAEATDAARKSQEAFDEAMMRGEQVRLDWLNRIDDATAKMQGPAAQAALTFRREVAEANAAMATGVITADEYGQYIRALEHDYTVAANAANKSIDEMTLFAEQAQRNMQSWLGDSLYQGLSGSFDGIADAFADMLKRMVAEMMASKILELLFGNANTGQGGIMSLYGGNGFGFASGGYTGPGGRNQPAGVVHKGEVVWSQHDIARAGGVGVVEAMRRGLRGYASGGIVGGGNVVAPGVTVNVHNAPAGTEVRQSRGTGGELQLDVIVKEFIGAAAGDLAGGGRMARAFEGRYGLRPAV